MLRSMQKNVAVTKNWVCTVWFKGHIIIRVFGSLAWLYACDQSTDLTLCIIVTPKTLSCNTVPNSVFHIRFLIYVFNMTISKFYIVTPTMVNVQTLNVGNVIQFILKECSMLSDVVCVFATVKSEPQYCSLIQIFLFNTCFSL